MSDSNTPSAVDQPRDSLSNRVVRRVATRTDRNVTALPALYEAIDPEALDRLVASTAERDTSLSVQFTYADQVVTIDQQMAITCEQQ